MTKTYYITTAIDYPNGAPHLGHAYEKVAADFYARYHRIFSGGAHFLTGTDENGQKLIKSAAANGKETAAFVDENVDIFKNLCSSLNISNDDFIRTTEKRHFDFVQDSWNTLLKKELIYKGSYSGHYCYDCENFYTESQAKDLICPEHGKKLELVEEEGYFFKLSKYQTQLIDLIEGQENFISPKGSRKEILTRLKTDDLRDIAVSRPSEGWGVPVPGDDKFVIYTWFDALMNYTSALDENQMKELWPANTHVIGKDIAWFHTVIWPSILMGLELAIPSQIYVHGMVLDANGKKMSKSLNNGVDPMEMIAKYPLDSFRYYLLYGIPALADGSFSEEELINTHNTALANDLGNLIMRIVKLALKKLDSEVLNFDKFTNDRSFEEFSTRFHAHTKNFDHNKAIDTVREYVQACNQYVNDTAPWQYKEEADLPQLKNIVFNCLYAIHCAAFHYAPAMPDIFKTIMSTINPSLDSDPTKEFENLSYTMKTPEILFEKILSE